MKKRYFILFAIFFFNPVFSVVDVLPDFLAYLFLMLAISKAKYFFDNLSDAYDSFKKVFTVTAIKAFCGILLPFVDETMALVLSFTFGMLEMIYGIPAFIKFFDSLEYAYLREDCTPVKAGEMTKKLTVIFFIAKTVLAILPDTLSLPMNDLGQMTLVEFRSLMFVLCGTVSLIFGIVWLFFCIRYFMSFFADGKFSENTERKFAEIKDIKKEMFMAKENIFAISMVVVSSFFIFDIRLNEVNVIFDSIFSLAVSVSLLYLIVKKRVKISPFICVSFGLSALHIASEIAETVLTIQYFDKYDIASMITVSEAEDMYYLVCAFSVISSVILLFEICNILLVMKLHSQNVIKENAEYFSEYKTDGFLNDYKSELNKKMILSIALAIVCCAAYIAYMFLRPYYTAAVLINPIAEIALIMSFTGCTSYISQTVYRHIEKYS